MKKSITREGNREKRKLITISDQGSEGEISETEKGSEKKRTSAERERDRGRPAGGGGWGLCFR